MLFALDISVNKKAPPTHSVHWGLTSPQKYHLFLFSKAHASPNPPVSQQSKPPYTATESFVIHIKTEDSYKGIADDVNKWFDNVNKANGTKERVVKIILKFNDYKNCLYMNETILKLK